MSRKTLRHFYNQGFGWICTRCESEPGPDKAGPARLLCEGESEEKHAQFSVRALAKWADDEKTKLICPDCGATEAITEK